MSVSERTRKIRSLEKTAWAPYEDILSPTRADWQKSYDALTELAALNPEDGRYPNTLGYLCYYGRHTGERDYTEARQWFEKGAELCMIESTYKLADMLIDGLGGPRDRDRAFHMYLHMYFYCRDEFEGGKKDSKFADTALRMGRLLHEGKIPRKDDMEALGYLLEAKYAIDWRKQYDEYGDDVVEKNILRLIDECEKPDEETRNAHYYGIGLGRVPLYVMAYDGAKMKLRIDVNDEGILRLEFRRKGVDGKKPNRILWSVPPAMRCFMTDFVVLYGKDVRHVWTKNPGEIIVCDRHEANEETGYHEFWLGEELQCKLKGGKYVLAMDEFWITEMQEAEDAGGEPQ